MHVFPFLPEHHIIGTKACFDSCYEHKTMHVYHVLHVVCKNNTILVLSFSFTTEKMQMSYNSGEMHRNLLLGISVLMMLMN